jgi:uncharacterized protein affecting Mg2+/Co2+ transport
MYHDEYATFIELVRAMHRGAITDAEIAPVLDRVGVDVADVKLDKSPNPEFHSDVVGYRVEITWQGANVPAEFVSWRWSDGHIDNYAGGGVLAHTFINPGEASCQCDVNIAEGHWQETAHWILPDDLSEPPPDDVPTMSNTKPEIVAWLMDHGVNFTESALMGMTKDELIDLVTDLLDNP